MSHRADAYVFPFSAGLKGLCLLILHPTDKERKPLSEFLCSSSDGKEHQERQALPLLVLLVMGMGV